MSFDKILGKFNNAASFISAVGIVVSIIWFVFVFDGKIDTMYQMTLKNTITNSQLGIEDRLEACDAYIGAGFNSFTKHYCEEMLSQHNFVKDVSKNEKTSK